MMRWIRRYFRTQKRMRKEVEMLQRALHFYADPSVYDDQGMTVRLDRGAAARQALIETIYTETGMSVL